MIEQQENPNPYAPPAVRESAPGTPPVRCAGFWIRFLATFIDSTLLSFIIYPVLISVYGISYVSSPTLIKGPVDFIVSWILPVVAVIAFWRWRQATPGKMLIRARIVDARTLERPTTGQLIGRYFAYLLSMLPLCLGFLWIAFDPMKQAWHDKLAGTLVVLGRPEPAEREGGRADPYDSASPERP